MPETQTPAEPQTAEDPEAQAKRDSERKEREDKLKEQEKKQALTDYEQRMKAVSVFKEMTDTSAWQQLYKLMTGKIAEHAEAVLDVELATKQVTVHQLTVKVYRDLILRVRAPVDALGNFAETMPLFAQSELKQTVKWDEKTGRVTIKDKK